MPSIFQRAQVACGGLDYGVRFGGKGCCKEWWDGNSFTAGRPQGSTFSTGTLSWKQERGGCYCFCCKVKCHSDIQTLYTLTLVMIRRMVMRFEGKKKSLEWTEIKVPAQSFTHQRKSHSGQCKNNRVKWDVAKINLISFFSETMWKYFWYNR